MDNHITKTHKQDIGGVIPISHKNVTFATDNTTIKVGVNSELLNDSKTKIEPMKLLNLFNKTAEEIIILRDKDKHMYNFYDEKIKQIKKECDIQVKDLKNKFERDTSKIIQTNKNHSKYIKTHRMNVGE